MLRINKNMKRRGSTYELLSSFQPRLTRHALERIWQRLCRERWLPVTLDMQWQKVRGMRVGHWIDPHRLRLIIEDIKQSIFSTTFYKEWRGLITEWDYGFYVIWPYQEIITVYQDFKWDYRAECKNVDFKFRREWLRQSPYLNKDHLMDQTCDFRTYLNRHHEQ